MGSLGRALAGLLPLWLVVGHPEKLVCKDPRLIEGGMMMHSYVVSNQYTSALVFSASATSYSKAGDEVRLTVAANGTRYVNESAPKAVFLAIQSRSACTLVGDHGTFSGLSADLDKTAGCASGVFSKTADGAFKGQSQAVWQAGPGTHGDVTFTLVWSNGPGASDPLSVKGAVRVPDPYLYTKTITISGPPGPCPPSPAPQPSTPGSPDKCVWHAGEAGRCPVAGVGAPVFVQDLGEDGEQTFPSGKCLPCRVDHRGTCKSAKVTCPSEPGGALREQIWAASRDCEGPASRSAFLTDRDAYCPGPEHYSVDSLDLERFVPKLQRDHKEHVKDEATARKAVEEYRKMLLLIQKFPERPVVPSKLVDLVWHEHILDTMRYKRDCLRMFGKYIHHNPSFGGEEEKSELQVQQTEMFSVYMETFNEPPPADVWPTVRMKKRLGAGGPLPDCCSARCVKPSCHDCVGCNSVDCGYMETGPTTAHTSNSPAKRTLSPDAFAGYVPARSPSQTAPAGAPYACSLTSGMPVGSPYAMSLEWTICSERIYFRHSLKGLSAWYSLGLAGKGSTDMGFGDYMLSMMTRNYSGVKDLYKYDAGNGYPCWDVLHECSVGNKTKGTKDVENDAIQRANGVTSSTWSRKLQTADYKDNPINRGNTTVMLAHGTEDYFTYHQKHAATCEVDFFSGFTSCAPDPAARGKVASFI